MLRVNSKCRTFPSSRTPSTVPLGFRLSPIGLLASTLQLHSKTVVPVHHQTTRREVACCSSGGGSLAGSPARYVSFCTSVHDEALMRIIVPQNHRAARWNVFPERVVVLLEGELEGPLHAPRHVDRGSGRSPSTSIAFIALRERRDPEAGRKNVMHG